ncbi:MAG: hypothetical protein ABR562_09940, partial [Thermoplasmatota archaeon]
LNGSHAEQRVVGQTFAWSIPDSLGTKEAACIPIPFGTAHDCLFEFGRLQRGESVLIHAGAGGVGSFAVQLAKHIGATVAATAGGRNAEFVRSLGADAPPLYYVTMPAGAMRGIVDAARAKGGSPPDSSLWGIEPDAFGDAAQPATFIVDSSAWAGRKLAALRCHRTQMGANNPIAWI